MLGIDWTAATLPGAFVVGLLFGCLLTVRLLRVLYSERRRQNGDD